MKQHNEIISLYASEVHSFQLYEFTSQEPKNEQIELNVLPCCGTRLAVRARSKFAEWLRSDIL